MIDIHKKIKVTVLQLIISTIVTVIVVLTLGVFGIAIIIVLGALFWWLAFADGINSVKKFIKEKTK